MGCQSGDQDEFDELAPLSEKGLRNGHIDWGIIHECTTYAKGLT